MIRRDAAVAGNPVGDLDRRFLVDFEDEADCFREIAIGQFGEQILATRRRPPRTGTERMEAALAFSVRQAPACNLAAKTREHRV